MKNSRLLRILATLLASLSVVAGLVACSDDEPAETVTQTAPPPTTPPPPTSPPTASVPTTSVPTTTTSTTLEPPPTTPTSTTESPTSTASSGDLESRLPAEDAVPGLGSGDARDLPTSQDLVDALYQSGDPTKPRAEERFANAGYVGGVLRDQRGSDPSTGLTLFRTYVVQLGSEDAANAEVDASVEEIKGSLGNAEDLEIPGVPTGRGLSVEVNQGGQSANVLFVTFTKGPYLYGFQAFASGSATLPRDEILQVAADTYNAG